MGAERRSASATPILSGLMAPTADDLGASKNGFKRRAKKFSEQFLAASARHKSGSKSGGLALVT
jgi:hypothetical protein